MRLPLNSADWEWIKSRIDRIGDLPPEERAELLERGCAERPDLASILQSMLDAPTETFRLSPGTLMRQAVERRTFAPGDFIAGRYRVRACVGSGGMGEVYEVEDAQMPERGPLALKTVRGDLLGSAEIGARFEREVRHALELAHPNVCRIYDVGRHGGTGSSGGGVRPGDVLFLTMEFLTGGTLSNWMKGADGRQRAIPEHEALPLIRQMAAGLGAIHEQRLIHRDFKPMNVMLVSSGTSPRAVITDFGLARTVRDGEGEDGDTTLTRTGASPGTPAYMAPELITGTAPASYASDVYSLGVTMLEMLTASRSGAADAGMALKTAGTSSFLSRVVLKCLERDPANRYQNAGALVPALSSPPEFGWRLSLRTAVFILVGFAVVPGGAWLWNNRGPVIPAGALNWYQGGIADMQAGSFYAAAKKFQEATRAAPDFTSAHVRLAEAWFDLEGHNLANAEMLKAVGKLSHEDEDYREGVRLTLAGEHDKAVASFVAYAAHASDAGGAQLAVAQALERADRVPEARRIYEGLASVYPLAGLRLAVLDAREHKWDKANREFDAAIAGFRKVTNADGETEVIYQQGLLNLQAVQLDDARQLLNEVLKRVGSTHNEFQQIRTQIDLSALELHAGRVEQAISLAREAMRAATEHQVEVMYYRANRGLGNAYYSAGNYKEAEPLLQEAARLARQDSDPRLEAGTLSMLSGVHNEMGRLSDAAVEAEKALAYYDSQKNPQLIVPAARAAANAYRDLGQFQKAFDLANHALSSATGDGLIGEAQEAVGKVELARERYTEAVSHLRLALDANRRAKNAIGILNETLYLGTAVAALGQFTEAARLFDEAMKLSSSDKGALNGIRLDRAEMELYRGNAAAAAGLVAGIPPDESDADQTARVALVADAARGGQSANRVQMLLKLDKEGLSFSLRRRVHFVAALDLFRAHDFAAATEALADLSGYSRMAELSWRALLLAFRLSRGEASAGLRRDALSSFVAASPFLGYANSNKPASTRVDLRDELREISVMSSGR